MAIIGLPSYYTDKPPVGSQINWGHPLSQGLVGCWLMNEGGGKRLTNIALNKASTTIDAGVTIDRIGVTTVGNDTASQSVAVGSVPLSMGLTVCSIVYPYTFVTEYGTALNTVCVSNYTYVSNQGQWFFGLSSSNQTIQFMRQDSSSDTVKKTSSGLVPLNKESFIVATYNGSQTSSGIDLFFNGVKQAILSENNDANGDRLIDGTNIAIGYSYYQRYDGSRKLLYIFNRVLSPQEIQSLYTAPYQFIQPIKRRFYFPVSGVSATLSGTVTTATEANIVAGGKTIILTLSGDTWIAAGAGSFDLQRQNIINGLTSAQSELFGWNNIVKTFQGIAGVVRTSDTVVTITLDAEATYDITATETITATIPGTAVNLGNQIIASPTFSITATQVAIAHQFIMVN